MNTTHNDPEYIIRIDYKYQTYRHRRAPDYVREGSGLLTFRRLADAAQVAQLLNMKASTAGAVFKAIDANGSETV
jgi:hypothetical protein